MADSEEHVPFVIVEQEEAPPTGRSPWLWGAAVGAYLVAALGAAAFFGHRRPTTPPSGPVEAISFAGTGPSLVDASVTVTVPADAGPAAPARSPIPPPPPATHPSDLAPTPPKSEVRVLDEERSPIVKKSPAGPAPPASEVERIPIPPPASTAPARQESPSVEKELASAAAAIRDARPLFDEIADRYSPPDFQNGDIRDLAAKMDRAETKLREAREIYARVRDRAPDPKLLDHRQETIGELLESLEEGRAKMRVPLALRTAEGLQEEAAPLAKEALEGFQPYSHEAQVLDVRAEVAAGKLREARRLYVSIRNDVPDPERVDERVKSVDSLLGDLEGRYPDVKPAH